MKTSYVINKFGSVKELADFFDISVQAVYKWGDEVPELREYQLRARRPDICQPKNVKKSS